MYLQTCDKQTTELSSLVASSTINLFGRSFFLSIAVDKSSVLELITKKTLKDELNLNADSLDY